MKFYSTNDRNVSVSLKTAVLQGLAADGGLYMPETINALPADFFTKLASESFLETSFAVAHHLLGDEVPESELRKITEHTLQFDAPVVRVRNNIYALELFHGPTMAFKDFGARFLSGLLGYFARTQEKDIVILVATSGDTGSAVANGFLNVPGTRVVVLYPAGKVSEVQEKQFTTLGGNITALEVEGTFDDCQQLVKQSFLDSEIKQKLVLASANSINIARLVPQTFYYFNAFAQLQKESKEIIFAVPSGNFGNLTAGLIAARLGLPVKKFIAATNVNDVVPDYLKTGILKTRRSTETISNAMDVGNPSNFARMQALYQNDLSKLQQDVKGYSFSDDETKDAMRELLQHGYQSDPHGAVGYLGLSGYMREHDDNAIGIFLETAHPGKFRDVVGEVNQKKFELPEKLKTFLKAEKKTISMENSFESLKKFLLKF